MKKPVLYLAPLFALVSLAACGPDPEARYARASDSFAQSDFVSARLDLISALKDRPEEAEFLTLLARTQIAMGDGEGALFALDRLMTAPQPDDFTALRAEAEVLRGQFGRALEILDSERSQSAKRRIFRHHATPECPQQWFALYKANPEPIQI